MAAAVGVDSKKSKRKPPTVKIPIPNSTEEAVIAVDLSWNVVFWNQRAEQIYGWKWQEVTGRSITELLVPEAAQPAAETIMKQLRQGKSWTGEITLRKRDGSQFTAKVTDKPMYDSKGNLVGFIGISHPTPAHRSKTEEKPA